MEKAEHPRRMIAYPIIERAVSGDTEAIGLVLKHFESYIIKMSRRQFYDVYGNVYYGVDEEIRHMIENRLIQKILKFKI